MTLDKWKGAIFRIGFLLEGRSDEEQPEHILGCGVFHGKLLSLSPMTLVVCCCWCCGGGGDGDGSGFLVLLYRKVGFVATTARSVKHTVLIHRSLSYFPDADISSMDDYESFYV